MSLSNSDRIKAAFVGGHVRRWHAEDIVGEERVDSHTWGMLAIIHLLHPSPSVALLGAVTFHDSPGEPFSGDIPYGAKQAFPALRDADNSISARVCQALGISYVLTPEEEWWLTFTDMAQAYLFASRQVAIGNALMILKVSECADQLARIANAANAPANAETIVADVLDCRMNVYMRRDVAALEEKAAR